MALAFLHDPSAPARCAQEVAEAAHVSDLPLWMGIHTGPVYCAEDVNAAENVRGPAINLAQRVMDCGSAGSTLLSYATADLLTPLREWSARLREIGEVEMKHGIRVAVHALTDDAGAVADGVASAPCTGLLPRDTTGRHDLPGYLTSFIGREREVGDIRAQVAGARLTTLTGPGGTGRTRLSVEVARGIAGSFADCPWMVDLAAIASPGARPGRAGRCPGCAGRWRTPTDGDALRLSRTADDAPHYRQLRTRHRGRRGTDRDAPPRPLRRDGSGDEPGAAGDHGRLARCRSPVMRIWRRRFRSTLRRPRGCSRTARGRRILGSPSSMSASDRPEFTPWRRWSARPCSRDRRHIGLC